LRGAIRSVLAQSYSNLEIIVTDDTGSSEQAAREFSDGRVRYRRSGSMAGPTANLRNGLAGARGELLALLDDDDRWHPRFLERATPQFERWPNVGVVFTDYYLITRARRMRRNLRVASGLHEQFLPVLLDKWPVAPSAAIFRSVVWEDGERSLPLLDHTLGAGTVWLRAAAAGWPFVYLDEPLMDYAIHPDQITWSRAASSRELGMLERFRFADPGCERLRRQRLARARLRTAGVDLRAGRLRRARRGIRAARADLETPLRPSRE
jgi:glycosyltransferase involved in cell wall biosynthesis